MTLRGLQLPEPSADAAHASLALQQLIAAEILQHGQCHDLDAGPSISFARFMELALYSPGLGYYSGGAAKLGQDGDFTTAPEITPLFGQTLAHVCAALQADAASGKGLRILEFGAGSGKLAFDLLHELRRSGIALEQYAILELSGSLRARQQAMLHEFAEVRWLDQLPASFSGVVLANEVLDAMPVHLVRKQDNGWHEMQVGLLQTGLANEVLNGTENATENRIGAENGQENRSANNSGPGSAGGVQPGSPTGSPFTWIAVPCNAPLLDCIARQIPDAGQLQNGYLTEVHPHASAFIHSLAAMLQGQSCAILLDYGFPAQEYYLNQRHQGTLHCHYRHHAHPDPFFLPGLQDITAHVDFTDIARAAQQAGLDVLSYSSQAAFLLDSGITQLLLRHDPADASHYLPQANAVQRLLSPAEMGELFKVLILGKNCDLPAAYLRNNRRDRL